MSTEIENALREYRQPDESSGTLTRLEDDIATIKAQIAAESDGGTVAAPPSEPDTHTHAENNDATDQPSANAPRQKKLNWVIDNHYGREGGSVKPSDIIDKVKDVYSFEERTAKKFVQPFVNEMGGKRHPKNPAIIVWGKEIERIKNTEEN